MTLFTAFLVAQNVTSPAGFVQEIAKYLSDANATGLRSAFARPVDADHLQEMAKDRGGLGKVQVCALPAPPGRLGSPYWIVFHAFQEIESYHDLVFNLAPDGAGWRIGAERLETEDASQRIASAEVACVIDAPASRIITQGKLRMSPSTSPSATILRLNNGYRVPRAWIDGRPVQVIEASPEGRYGPGDLVRAGGLLIPWTTRSLREIRYETEGVINHPPEDRINEREAFVTASWVPSAARLPFTTRVRVDAPAGWVVRSEGLGGKVSEGNGRAVHQYRCDLPISYPKVIAGNYRLVATKKDRGRTFRSYQQEPIEPERGARDVERAAAGVAWFEDRLGKFPFPGYDVLDSTDFYGIESYSYTLLRRDVTTKFVTHEIGHTYFGGLAPCPYVVDSWNEGFTQFIDGVSFLLDDTLRSGPRVNDVSTPLNQLAVPHAAKGASYWRGAYVLRMLENEIGRDAVWSALRTIATTRKGQNTTWDLLLPVFEQAAAQELSWFWRQWVQGAKFPRLRLVSQEVTAEEGQFSTRWTIRQEGTDRPFRLRLGLVTTGDERSSEQVVELASTEGTFRTKTAFKPTGHRIETFGYALLSP